ncbi:hypothetical protein [Chitinophaga pinensis]|nr:hypothetical protein [Chitinophaga pinensis]
MIREQLYEPYAISVQTMNEYPKGARQTAFLNWYMCWAEMAGIV